MVTLLFVCKYKQKRMYVKSVLLYADWPSVDAYYYGSSSAHSIPNIHIPLLCIQASFTTIVACGPFQQPVA